MYVSDFLETVFPSISKVRSQVGALVYHLGDKLPESLRVPLDDRLRYYSTKCMGYPAVWATFRMLNVPEDQVPHRLAKHQTALCMSLSTSILDELIDQESHTPSSDTIVFYLLMYNALENNQWHQNGLGNFIFKESVEAANLFIEKLMKQRDNPIYAQPDYGLKRIGNFHKMIAYDLTKDLSIQAETKNTIVDIVGQLGNWYAALDDFLDFEIDAANDVRTSFVQGILVKHFPHLINVIETDQQLIVEEYTRNEQYALLIIDELLKMLSEIVNCLEANQYIDYALELSNGHKKVKDLLLKEYKENIFKPV